jgi:hypothetical protein
MVKRYRDCGAYVQIWNLFAMLVLTQVSGMATECVFPRAAISVDGEWISPRGTAEFLLMHDKHSL